MTLKKITFAPATKEQRRLRLALVGYEGQGKTYTALAIAKRLAEWRGGKIAFGDTEGGSASIYADKYAFDVVNLTEHTPEHYVDLIRAAEAGGYAVLIIDSLSHEWMGAGGLLEVVDSLKQGGGYGWDKATPRHRKVFEAIIASKIDVIATMRQKKAYIEEDRGGKKRLVPHGTEPIQREGAEFEFDVIATVREATMTVTKSRIDTMPTEKHFVRPGADVAELLIEFLKTGAPPAEKPAEDPAGIPEVATAPDGEPVTDAINRVITEALQVVDPKRKDEARAALKELIAADGLPTWADFLARGRTTAPKVITLLQQYDRAKANGNGVALADIAAPAATEPARA